MGVPRNAGPRRVRRRPTAARLWFEKEYVPIVELRRDAGMIGDGTQTEAYLRIVAHRY